MRARDLVGQVPTVEMDLPVVDAARMLADQCLPGLIVVDQSVSLLGVVTLDSLLKRMFAT